MATPMSERRERLGRQAAFVLSAGALAGILIWSKLRLVTNIPRSAYAVPEGHQPGNPDANTPPVQPEDSASDPGDAEYPAEPGQHD